ncbi:beta-ketoacyl-ACP synthase II [Deinococcus peraridilitoris]|uniref:3-oxoacyl-[acyl-carrier-protein] synthase 2 n=1 Tax=Deinococcus peraridilitoris (strain DSM 19664 / LMG 22246 / CIP 109416 / KR-200) TaxID=937777 RepID=K9ZYL0_DEIPD|nr:beta-ketoacyl-ACP synthase II [Deinococcus peraridilitoris]AFZ66661.1 beta-ketoacyl-acyl-carrier-protein synthase II [Deinococcus peraridilitoris DSM 19664]
MKRVVITGLGPLTPIGMGAKAYAEAQRAGKSGIGTITRFDASPIACRIAGEIKDDYSQYLDLREARRMDRYVHYAFAATALAVEDAGLSEDQIRNERTGCLIGSGIGGIETFEAQAKVFTERGPGRISPMFIPMMIANMASGQVAIRYGAAGPSSTVVTACATGSTAIGEAARYIRDGDADMMFAGGSEAAITPMSMGGFSNMKALSFRNDEPQKASRPFSASRDGFVLSEGAGMLVLEELEHAKKRGARIYAELLGYGCSADAYHITSPAPEGRGIQNAMRMALRHAGLNPEDVQYINAHATSTPAGDQGEVQAIKAVFGDHARKLAISATKSMTGHLLGAAGAIEAIAAVQALSDGVIPPTINLDDPDPELDLDFVPHQPREQKLDVVMSNSFAFGGQNAVLVMKRFDG